MSKPELERLLRDYPERIEALLDRYLPAAEITPQRLHQAMRYAVLHGGKRFRPVLVYATAETLGIAAERVDAIAAAIEVIHAYSLIHDDLPAMDDDDLRRGRPTCHKAFDEATAILAGDALQALAFHLLAQAEEVSGDPLRRLKMIEQLAAACGSRGMAGGQILDLAAEGQQLNLAELENLHIHKTGALIRSCVQLVLLAAEGPQRPSQAMCSALDHYAKCIGLAFQVRDDILDVSADTATLGKTSGKDQQVAKATYPGLLGLEESRAFARELQANALRTLEPFDQAADPLRWLADYVVNRQF